MSIGYQKDDEKKSKLWRFLTESPDWWKGVVANLLNMVLELQGRIFSP
jgi:hypothetical protein